MQELSRAQKMVFAESVALTRSLLGIPMDRGEKGDGSDRMPYLDSTGYMNLDREQYVKDTIARLKKHLVVPLDPWDDFEKAIMQCIRYSAPEIAGMKLGMIFYTYLDKAEMKPEARLTFPQIAKVRSKKEQP